MHRLRNECHLKREANRRVRENAELLRQQIDEDTCDAHGIFCCDECFDMHPHVDDEELM